MRIPPETEHLMWALAENPTPQALDEFGERYPEYRGELLKRVDMIRGLRVEAKGPSIRRSAIPKFEPKPIHPATSPKLLYMAFGLGMVAIAVAGLTAVSILRQPAALPRPVKDVVIDDRPLNVPQVQYTQPVTPPPNPYQSYAPTPPQPSSTAPPAVEEQRRDLSLHDVQLLDALDLITAGTHCRIEIGPGFVNQKVTADFHGRTTPEMLKELAKDYAFTAEDEGQNHWLLLPVPDNETESSTGADASRRITP